MVFFDDKWLCFTVNAFSEVCQAIVQSRSVITHALFEAGLFGGCPINKSTFLTRITVHNAYGQRKPVHVYKLARDSFENFGDPLNLGEEAV